MRVQRVEIGGFRGIGNIDIALHDQLTVFVGANGVGKTTILDAIAILLDNYVARWLKGTAQSAERIRDVDLKIGSSQTRLAITVDSAYGPAKWILRRQDRYEKIMKPAGSDLDGLNALVRRAVEGNAAEFWNSPLFIYYGQRRAVLDVPQRIRVGSVQRPEAAFTGALKLGDLNFREFVAWFRDRSLDEAQHWRTEPDYRDNQLDAVRAAMTGATGLNNPVYKVGSPSGLLIEKNGVSLRVDQLSSGERSFLSLAGDLARRLAMLNPSNASPLEGEGVVLIDEIELHLHPIWQRKIIPFLRKTFPNCQFIVTTHSPQALGMVHAENIVVVKSTDGDVHTAMPLASYGRDSNFILLSVLQGEERDAQLKERLRRLDIAITQSDFSRAERILARLTRSMEGNPPEIALAQARLERAKRRAQN